MHEARSIHIALGEELTGLNAGLRTKQFPPIKVITPAEWDKE